MKTFSSETPVIFGAIYFESEEQTKSHWWSVMKLQLKCTAIMYGNFCSLDLCLLWQSNTEYTMAFQAWRIKLWKMKCSYENGAKKMYESLSATKIFLKFEMLKVKTFQTAKVNTDKTPVTRVIPNTIHCLKLPDVPDLTDSLRTSAA